MLFGSRAKGLCFFGCINLVEPHAQSSLPKWQTGNRIAILHASDLAQQAALQGGLLLGC